MARVTVTALRPIGKGPEMRASIEVAAIPGTEGNLLKTEVDAALLIRLTSSSVEVGDVYEIGGAPAGPEN